MNRILKNYSFLMLAVLLLASCASTKTNGNKLTFEEYTNRLDERDFDTCIDYLESQNKKKNNNRIKDNFDEAMLLHYKGEYEKSLEILNSTDFLMHDAFTKSISKEAGAALFNENVTEYAGNVYEYIYINLFNSLNYYNAGNVDEAAVEIRKMNDKQREYFTKYGETALTELDDSENEDEAKTAYKILKLNQTDINKGTPNKPTEADIFRDSPSARYLSMLFYMMDGDPDNAELDAKILKTLNPSFDLEGELKVSRDKGRLNVLSFTDLIGRRTEERITIGPFPDIVYTIDNISVYVPEFCIAFVYPKFAYVENSAVNKIKVLVNGQEKYLSLLEDYNYAVQKDVNLKARKQYGRSVRRSLGKTATVITTNAATIVTAKKAAEKLDGIPRVVAEVGIASAEVAFAVAISAMECSETADIRQVSALPGRAYATGIDLEPGTYDVTVQYLHDDEVISEESYSNIVVKAGKPTIVESIYN